MQTTQSLPISAVTGLFARFDNWLTQRQMRETEAWLATSQTVAELEARMRDLDRPLPQPYY